MIYYTIKKPWWDGEKVGIAEKRVKGDTTIEIKIDYRNAQGDLEYPYRYQMETKKIRTYPTHITKVGNIKLFIVPIADFKVAGDRNDTARKT